MAAPRIPSSKIRSRRKGGNGASIRATALGITAAIHLLAAAVAALAFDWRQAGMQHPMPSTRLVTFAAPAPPTEHRNRAPARRHPQPKVGAIRSSIIPPPPVLSVALRTAPALLPKTETAIEAAPASTEGNLPDIALAYRRALMARLEAQRSYPAMPLRKGWQGTGSLLFRIDRDGHLLGTEVLVGTGHVPLDEAARDIIIRAAPFPAIPDGLPDELSITLPIAFLIDAHAQSPATP